MLNYTLDFEQVATNKVVDFNFCYYSLFNTEFYNCQML